MTLHVSKFLDTDMVHEYNRRVNPDYDVLIGQSKVLGYQHLLNNEGGVEYVYDIPAKS